MQPFKRMEQGGTLDSCRLIPLMMRRPTEVTVSLKLLLRTREETSAPMSLQEPLHMIHSQFNPVLE